MACLGNVKNTNAKNMFFVYVIKKSIPPDLSLSLSLHHHPAGPARLSTKSVFPIFSWTRMLLQALLWQNNAKHSKKCYAGIANISILGYVICAKKMQESNGWIIMSPCVCLSLCLSMYACTKVSRYICMYGRMYVWPGGARTMQPSEANMLNKGGRAKSPGSMPKPA